MAKQELSIALLLLPTSLLPLLLLLPLLSCSIAYVTSLHRLLVLLNAFLIHMQQPAIINDSCITIAVSPTI